MTFEAIPKTSDPGGYLRLRRSLAFVAQELREANDVQPAEDIERAIAFFGGSPSEFLGESLISLDRLLDGPVSLSPSVGAFASALAAEIRAGFRLIGGG